jgi:RHS repeat-associated protein
MRSANASKRNPLLAAAALLVASLIGVHGLTLGAPNAGEQAIEQLRLAVPTSLPGQSATLLPDGRWLLLGGIGTEQRPTQAGMLVTGATGDTTVVQVEMSVARSGHTATLLPNGAVLIVGGVGEDGRVMAASETFDLDSLSFAPAPGIELLPRAFHTTTLLTDGRLLIAGGIGANGTVLDDAEILDPLDDRVERFNARLETARYGHLATLLPSAPVLVWGGLNQKHQALQSGELFDPESRRFSSLDTYNATLLPQAGDQLASPAVAAMIPSHGATDVPVDQIISVRFSKPMRVETLNAQSVTLFGPTGTVAVDVVPTEGGLLVFVTPTEELLPGSSYTLFIRSATDTDAVSLPFTASGFSTAALGATVPIPPPTAASTTPARVGAPAGATQPGATVSAQTGNATTSSTLGTQTSQPNAARGKPGEITTTTPSTSDPDEEWTPGPTEYQTGNWITNRRIPAFAGMPKPEGLLRKSASTVTALSGLVLKLNDKPLPGVTLRIGQRTAQTSADGTFLIEDLAPGEQTLVIDATTAGPGYGYFETLVDVAPGMTTTLPYSIWIPRLDRKNAVRIPSPTLSEVVLTTPKMPGFAVVIPPGVVIRDRAGKIVTELSITPIPIDRTPFPLPIIFEFDTFYTIQPAGAVLQSLDGTPVKARVIYPNYANVAAGTRMLFWNHDPTGRGWHIYGEGQVSDDAQAIVPAANVGIYQFSGFMVSAPGTKPPSFCPCGAPGGDSGPGGSGDPGSPGVPFAGDPVNLATGQFIHAHTDLVVNDIVPLRLRRTYISNDAGGDARPFGWNMSPGMDYLLYNPNPTGPTGPVTHLYLTTPDGASIDLLCVQGCSQTQYGIFEGQTLGYFYKATMVVNTGGFYPLEWILTTKDGAKYVFYNNGGKIKYISDRYGNTTQFLRTPFLIGNLTTVVSPNGKSIELLYTGNLVTAARDNSGRTWTYTYNGRRMISATDPMGGTWQYTYDSYVNDWPNMLTVQDPRGNTIVTNEYDFTRVKKQTYADGSTTSFAWTLNPDATIQQVDVTDRRGNVRRVSFNPIYRISSDTFALGKPESQTTTLVRDPTTNLLLSETDPLGRVTSYTYDAKGNTLNQTRLAGTSSAITASYTYEPTFNQLATVTDPLGHVTTLSRDNQGNVTQVTDANNNTKTMTFNSAGQVVSMTDSLSNLTSFGYAGGVLTSITDPLGRTTAMSLDTVGRVVSTKDAQGNAVQTDYDPLDRITRVTDPLGNTSQFLYDTNGNLLSYIDPRGNSTVYTYDLMNRVSSKKDAILNLESYTYDIGSMLTRVTDRKGQVSGMAYDALNRRISIGFGASANNPGNFDSTISYVFDAGNRLAQIVDSQSGTITRSYDGLDRLGQEQGPQGIVSYTYDAAGRRASMTVTGQSAVTYSYDYGNRLIQIQEGSQSVGFTYDVANRRTQTSLPNGVTINYSYDGASQIASIVYKKGAATIGDLSHSYDASGHRVSVSGGFAKVNLPSSIVAAAYNANNQLAQWGPQALAYDLNGNLLGDGINTYIWNSRNQLQQIKQGTIVVAQYQYDANGRRMQKTTPGGTTQYLYDGRIFIQELAGDGSVTSNIIAGVDTDELYTRTRGGNTYSFLTDHLGSIVAETDSTGTLQTNYAYEPYGQTSQTGPTSDNSQRFTGREQDMADLYYHRARYYASSRGQFIAEEPRWVFAEPNRYAYARESPSMYIDADGNSAVLPIVVCGISGAGGWYLYNEIKKLRCKLKNGLDPGAIGDLAEDLMRLGAGGAAAAILFKKFPIGSVCAVGGFFLARHFDDKGIDCCD